MCYFSDSVNDKEKEAGGVKLLIDIIHEFHDSNYTFYIALIKYQLIMKRSKYVLLLLASIVFYMLYTSSVLVNLWMVDLSHQPQHYTLQASTATLPPVQDTIGRRDLEGILFDGQV